jgi:hypothetical protein
VAFILLGPQSVLQIGPPPVEELLGRGIESWLGAEG